MPSRDPNGLTDHEILMEIRTDLKRHMRTSQNTEVRIQLALAKRPTRGEVIRWVGAASGLLALVVALV